MWSPTHPLPKRALQASSALAFVIAAFGPDVAHAQALAPLTPGSCGAIEADAYLLDGLGIGAEPSYRLNSGAASFDPDVFFGSSGTEFAYTKNADGTIDYFFDGETAVATVSTQVGFSGNPFGNLSSVNGNAADQTDAAEFWRIESRLDGVPGTTYTFEIVHGGTNTPFEFFHYWAEDSSGNILGTSLGSPNSANGWIFGAGSAASTSSASGGTSISGQTPFNISYTLPASNTDGIVFLRVLMLDPQAVWGPIDFDYDCPDPVLTVTKASSTQGAVQADGTFTQTFTVNLENTGNLTISAPTLVDDIEALFADAFDPATGVTSGPTVAAVGTFNGTLPGPNTSFNGDGSDDLLDGTGSLVPGDELQVTFTVELDASELSGSQTNTVTTSGTNPSFFATTFVDNDAGAGNATNDGTSGAAFTPPAFGIVANDDDFSGTPIASTAGGVTASVLTDDTLNGTLLATDGSQTTISITDEDGLTGVTIADNGVITVPPNTTPGTYNVEYELCNEADTDICDTAIATIVVGSISASDDDFSTPPVDSTVGGSTPTVLSNDTLNGVAVATDGSETTISITDNDGLTGATIADNGVITVPPNTTPGLYEITYELCDETSPTECDTAVATFVVGTIVAEDDNFASAPVNNITGGTTPSVLSDDLLNGSSVATNGAQTTLAILSTGGLTGATIADNGVITVPPNSNPGTFNITYELCDQSNPTDCDTAIATVVVSGTLIPAIEDELKSVLQDDLAVTMARQSAQASDYAKGALERLRSHNRSGQECAAAATLRAQFILFDTDKAVIKPQSERALDEIAAILGSCAGSAFEIAGHTDSDASDAYNVDLSQRRVNAVLFALQQRDVDTSNFVAMGYGESQPIASNATEAGKARNRRVAFVFIEDGHDANFRACHDGAAPTRNFNLTANENGVSIDGDLHSETYNCATNRWAIFEGNVTYTDTDSGIAQGALTLSYRRERLVDNDSLRGFFVGLYGSRSDVTNVATGEIDGFGVNAGLYGAEHLRDNLFVDAHIGVATGIHDFDLAFDDALGTIEATGDYQYIAAFFGAALSGEMVLEQVTIGPRVGFEYAYSPGGDVDVTAALAGLSESGSLDLDTVSGGSIFAEARIARVFNDSRSEFALTPRVACFQSLESFDDECSFGASLAFATLEATDELLYSVELSGERASSFSRASLTASVSKALGLGEISATAGVDSAGVQRLSGLFELQF